MVAEETKVGGTVTMSAFTTATADKFTLTASTVTENTAFTHGRCSNYSMVYHVNFTTTDTIGDAMNVKINDADLGVTAT